MGKREFVKAIKAAREVIGAVRLNENSTIYVRLVKSDLLASIECFPSETVFDAVLSDGVLAVN